MKPIRPLIIFGTRPEAIKLAPLIRQCHEHSEMEPIVCLTGQHREMLAQVTEYFEIQADADLEVMQQNQTLATLTAKCIEGIDQLIQNYAPTCVVAQGDTTTVMAASLTSFYHRKPFVHVEAGLRTGDLMAPWPEELNRRITSLTANLHCAPTTQSADNLIKEGTPQEQVHVTGNTVIDALLWAREKERKDDDRWKLKYAFLVDHRMVLITGHRRENFGGGFEDICRAIVRLSEQFPDVEFLYPVHLNPNVQEPVNELLAGRSNVHLTSPAPYPEFVWLMDRSTMILSDSGGVQEEAPSLRKPLLVMRETTERPEAVDAGAVELVGTSVDKIVSRTSALLSDPAEYQRHQIDNNPYGDGNASARITKLMTEQNW